MLIKSQDKKTLGDYVEIRARKEFGKNKGIIYGITSGTVDISDATVVGVFKTEEDAINELEKICKEIKTNPNNIYEVSENI